MKYIVYFKKTVIVVLVITMAFIICLSLANLGNLVYLSLTSGSLSLLNIESLKGLFGALLFVIVGLELLETIIAYIKEDVVHAEVVILASIIGLANKVIVLDLKQTPADSIIALAGLLLALGVVYFLLKDKLTISSEKRDSSLSRALSAKDAENSQNEKH